MTFSGWSRAPDVPLLSVGSAGGGILYLSDRSRGLRRRLCAGRRIVLGSGPFDDGMIIGLFEDCGTTSPTGGYEVRPNSPAGARSPLRTQTMDETQVDS